MNLLKASWTNTISKCFEKFANKEFPPLCQSFINKTYVKCMGVDMSEFNPPHNYKSLNALFTRALIKKRNIDEAENSVISPTDSLVTAQGKIKEDLALQIKGLCYSVDELLTDKFEAKRLRKLYNGEFINLYLSPKDYHRYHLPLSAKINKIVYVPGSLYPVNNTYLNSMVELFIKNERVIIECEHNRKLFYMVMIGALNVGKMTIKFDDSIETNSDAKEIKVYDYEDIALNKAYELGMFKMGSTVVLLFQKGFVTLEDSLGKKVRFGEKIATIKN
jgi:phosphatidylserine decarboxylase